MARALRVQYPGALYHVSNRGNERKAIFKDDVDREAFLKILSQSIDTYSITLHSYVLMNNHWHILAQTSLANLGEFMRHFNITYTSHFNRRHNRSGHLYQGRYKSFLVEADSYLSQVSRYIHLNPVQVAGMKDMQDKQRLRALWNYKWSSLPGFVNLAKRREFVEYSAILAEYGGDSPGGRRRYKKQIVDDLAEGLAVKESIVGQSILGGEGFVAWVRETYLESRKDREQPAVRKIHQHVALDIVLAVVEEETGISDAVHSAGTTRQIVMTALYKYAGLTNKEIGNVLGVDYSTVSQGRKRLRDKAEKDKQIRSTIETIDVRLSRIKI